MKIHDPNVGNIELVEVDESEESIAGIAISIHFGECGVEILLTEDEIKKMAKWIKTGKRPR